MIIKKALYLIVLTAVVFATAVSAQTYDNKYARKFVLGDNSAPVISLTLKTPTTLTSAYSLIFPPAVGGLGQIFITTDAAGTLGWTDPATVFAGSYWSISGNATASAYNGTTGNFLGTTSLFPLVFATTNATAQPIEFFTGGSERVRVASTGELLVGTTTAVSAVTVNGEVYANTLRTIATTGKPAYAEARVFYDTAEKTIAYYNDHSGVTMNLGQEEWVRVKNVTGASIANGSVVYINGNDVATGLPTIGLSKSDALATTDAIGICTETITNNSTGYVTSFGVVHQLNTSAFSAGQPLYVSPTTAGAYTATRPLSPNFTMVIGYIAFVDATLGKILVNLGKPRFGLFTAGAIAFAGSDGWLKQSASKFFFDSTNSRLGIGTNTPGQSLEIKSGNLLLSNAGTANQLQLQGTSTGISTFQAGAQGATNLNYTLPTTIPTVNQVLTATAVSSPSVTLGWTSNAITVIAGNTAANSLVNNFFTFSTGQNAAENKTQIVATRSGVVQNLYVSLTAAPGVGTSKTLTVRINGVNTALAVTVAGAATTGNNTANVISFVAGDLISIQVTHTGAVAGSIVIIGFELAM